MKCCTVFEMIVAIGMVAILAAMLIPTLDAARRRTQMREIKLN